VFEVFNGEVSLGKTPDVPIAQGSSSCNADPYGCNLEAGVSKGQFLLQKDVQYNLHIVARRSDCDGCEFDGGWFRLKTTADCDGNDDGDVAPPPCPAVGEKCSNANPCCAGLECRPSSNDKGRRCVDPNDTGDKPPEDCAAATETCGSDDDCCEGLECRLHHATGKRTCRRNPQPVCAAAGEKCQNGLECCVGLSCQLSQDTGERTCQAYYIDPGQCAAVTESCGRDDDCCDKLACRRNQATGERTCRPPKCIKGNHRCGKAKRCCQGLVCRRRRGNSNGKRRCRTKNSDPENATCARLKDRCGNGVDCCAGLACRADRVSGVRKCRRKKNGGSGGTTMGTGGNENGNGGGDAVPGPMGIGVP
jgi:hypothetical protein